MTAFRVLVLATAATSGVLLAPAVASAHAMHAKVTVADEVKAEVYFDEEMPGDFATVSVVDESGKEVLTGKADEHGVFTFAKPAPGQYTLKAEHTGHTAKRKFQIEGAPEAPPVVYTDGRWYKLIGITVGVVLLLGISAVSWFLRRRRRG